MTRRKAQQIGRKRIRKGKAIQTRRDVRREAPIPGPSGDAGKSSGPHRGQRKSKRVAKRQRKIHRDEGPRSVKRQRSDQYAGRSSMSDEGSSSPIPGSSGDFDEDEERVFCDDILAYNTSFDRFRNGRVFVKTKGSKSLPHDVWFTKRDKVYNQGNHYEISKTKGATRKYEKNVQMWRELAEAGGNEDVHTMMSIFEELAKYVAAPDGNNWVIQRSECTVGEFYRRACQMKKMDGGNVMAKVDLIGTFLRGRLLKALEENMMNSVGRGAVQNLILCACQCAFGYAAMEEARVAVHSVGSSRNINERFPISQVQVDEGLLMELQGPRTPAGSTQTGSCGSNQLAAKALKRGEVYSDILVIEGDEDTSKILLVVEVKSETDLGKHEDQIWLEMLGPLMYQNLVFGLLINAFKAQLYIMERDDKFRAGKISVENVTYTLQHNEKFDVQNFKNLFIDIMAAMEYGKANVKIVSALK